MKLFHKKDNNLGDTPELPRLWEITVGDVNSFSRLWSLKITVPRLIAIISAAVVAIAWIGVFLIAGTPLRVILPGYLGGAARSNYEELVNRVDSLTAVTEIQNDYLSNVTAILTGNVEDNKEITVSHTDSVGIIPIDSILPTSDTERKFVKDYADREKHNLSVLTPITAEGMIFFRPVTSSTPSETDNSTGVTPRSLTLITSPGARVSSIYRGTVTATWFDPQSGTAAASVQHPHDFISIYTGMRSLYVSKGDKVEAGSAIGAMPSQSPRLVFEIWHDGTAINPQEYIAM